MSCQNRARRQSGYSLGLLQDLIRKGLKIHEESGAVPALEFLASHGVAGDLRFRLLAGGPHRATDLALESGTSNT